MIHLFAKTWNLHRFLNYLFVFALHLIFDSFRVVFFYHYIHYHQVLLLSANLLFQIVVNIWVTLFSLVMHHACNAIYCCIKFEMKLNHDDNDLLISFTRVLPAPTGQVVMLWLSYWWQWFSSGNYSDLGAIVSRAWIGCFVRRVGKSLETAFVHKHVNCLQIFSWSFPQIFFSHGLLHFRQGTIFLLFFILLWVVPYYPTYIQHHLSRYLCFFFTPILLFEK